MLRVPVKYIMLDVIMLSVFMINVVALMKRLNAETKWPSLLLAFSALIANFSLVKHSSLLQFSVIILCKGWTKYCCVCSSYKIITKTDKILSATIH